MKPYIVLHNSITLDGSLTGFMPDMELHYRLAGNYNPDANLIGADTVILGQEMFGDGIPDEEEADFTAPVRKETLPWWIIVDSGGRLRGMLHTCRRFEYCRDVIVLVSESTPEDYLKHLKERNYNYIVSGKSKVDLKEALSVLSVQFGINRILTDTGRILGNVLLTEGLVDEISLLIHPMILGEQAYSIFGNLGSGQKLTLLKEERFDNGCIWVTYRVEKSVPVNQPVNRDTKNN